MPTSTHVMLVRSPMPVSADALFRWHERPGALERLTPQWEGVEIGERIGTPPQPGSRVTLRTKTAGVPLEWTAEHTRYEQGRLFEDRQVSGPFREFVQTHRTLEDGDTSILEDELRFVLPLEPMGRVALPSVRRRLERMFLYRHAITRMDLERHARFAQSPLQIAISGASGVIGSALSSYLSTAGHTVKRLVRRASAGEGEIAWDAAKPDVRALEGFDAVIHLAGSPLATRWNARVKREILTSRLEGTRVLAEAIASLERKPRVFISSSAVGYYGDRGDEVLDESSAPGGDFLADVCRQWERATEAAGVRTVTLRTGVVLSGRGGALGKMVPAFLSGVGGPLGTGRQWMSWISLEDVLGAIEAAIHDEAFHGALNLTAPEPVQQRDFARTLGKVLKRPSLVTAPAFAIGALFGEMGRATVLASQRALPRRLMKWGFPYVHASLEEALRFHLGRAESGLTTLTHG